MADSSQKTVLQNGTKLPNFQSILRGLNSYQLSKAGSSTIGPDFSTNQEQTKLPTEKELQELDLRYPGSIGVFAGRCAARVFPLLGRSEDAQWLEKYTSVVERALVVALADRSTFGDSVHTIGNPPTSAGKR